MRLYRFMYSMVLLVIFYLKAHFLSGKNTSRFKLHIIWEIVASLSHLNQVLLHQRNYKTSGHALRNVMAA